MGKQRKKCSKNEDGWCIHYKMECSEVPKYWIRCVLEACSKKGVIE